MTGPPSLGGCPVGEGCWRTASNKRHMPVDNGSARARPVAAPRLEPSPPPPNAGTLHNMRWEDLVGDEAWDSTFSRRLLPFHLELQHAVPDMALGGGGISNLNRCKPRRHKGLRARGFASSNCCLRANKSISQHWQLLLRPGFAARHGMWPLPSIFWGLGNMGGRL